MSSAVFRSRHIEVLGHRLHVREAGAGDPVVLVHGLGVSGRYLEPLGELLARQRRVVIPDLPGWGQSERPPRALDIEAAADVLAELVRRETAEPTPFVANSLGCQVVVALGQWHPDLAGPLVLIGPTVDPLYRSWGRHAWRIAVDTLHEPVSLWPILLGDYARMGVPRVVATARAALDDRPETRLPTIASPVLVLRGEHDRITTADWGRRCASLAPRGRYELVPRSAHAAHFSDPRPVSRLVESFLAETGNRLG
jgi:pimeloyl-ACP methyl ester carboxylesterase